jgi:hypothetical protein
VTETNSRVPTTKDAIYLIIEVDPVSEILFEKPHNYG